MKSSIFRRFFSNAAGTMAIETAMLLPVFISMTLGGLGYGYVIYTKQEIYFIADEVAREIYLNPALSTEEIVASVEAKVETSLNMEKFSVASVSTDIGDYEYRTISINYTMPIVLLGYNNNEIDIAVEKKVIISD